MSNEEDDYQPETARFQGTNNNSESFSLTYSISVADRKSNKKHCEPLNIKKQDTIENEYSHPIQNKNIKKK